MGRTCANQKERHTSRKHQRASTAAAKATARRRDTWLLRERISEWIGNTALGFLCTMLVISNIPPRMFWKELGRDWQCQGHSGFLFFYARGNRIHELSRWMDKRFSSIMHAESMNNEYLLVFCSRELAPSSFTANAVMGSPLVEMIFGVLCHYIHMTLFLRVTWRQNVTQRHITWHVDVTWTSEVMVSRHAPLSRNNVMLYEVIQSREYVSSHMTSSI